MFCLLAVARLDAVAQRTLPDGYTRRVWQTQDGLPESTVQAFAQTSDHYLWIGTSGGLVRFDGARCLSPTLWAFSYVALRKVRRTRLMSGWEMTVGPPSF